MSSDLFVTNLSFASYVGGAEPVLASIPGARSAALNGATKTARVEFDVPAAGGAEPFVPAMASRPAKTGLAMIRPDRLQRSGRRA
ncbi:hypothetical protein JSE7799_01432 [Jannaschia seosinensis]|uniref:Uncharacterized protein n=1 Tax=Jannaschia seosinensis TaxID=313367 RepID=A0A0M7BBK7_9RHOB|nr:hypothetical protein JSE7799_01432 [Jannaschia seosinensis]